MSTSSGGQYSYSYNTKNQIVGFGYDASGNLLTDGSQYFTYNAENQITVTGFYAYYYDASGKRVIKEKNAAPQEKRYYIYDKRRVVISEYYRASSGPFFWRKDLMYLGTLRMKQ